MDIQVMESMFKFGKILALTPTSTKKGKVGACVQKSYSFLIFTFYTAAVIIGVFYRKIPRTFLNPVELFLKVLIDIDNYAHSFYILVILNTVKRNCWHKLIKNLREVDNVAYSIKSYYLILSIASLIFCSTITLVIYVSIVHLGIKYIELNLILYFEFCTQFFYTLLACIVLRMLLSRYQHQHFLLRKSVEKIKFDIVTLKDTVDTFNEIFGWSILFNIVFVISKTLIYFALILKGISVAVRCNSDGFFVKRCNSARIRKNFETVKQTEDFLQNQAAGSVCWCDPEQSPEIHSCEIFLLKQIDDFRCFELCHHFSSRCASNIFKIGNILALTPASVGDRKSSLSRKIYGILVFVLYTVGVIASFLYRRSHYSKLTLIQLVLRILLDVDLYAFTYHTVIVLASMKGQQWFKLFKGLKSVDYQLFGTRSYYLILIMAHVALWSVSILAFYVWINFFGISFLGLYLVEFLQMYSLFFYSLVTCIVLRMLLSRYKYQNFLLREQIVLTGKLFSKRTLKKVVGNTFILKQTVDAFNDIFGWIILFDIFFGALRSLIYLDVAIKGDGHFSGNSPFGNFLHWLSHISVISLYWVGILATILLCDNIMRESEELLGTFQQMEFALNENEICMAMKMVSYNRPKFDAARYFSISRTTIFKILNSLTTFLLVMIQFKSG
ncbi:gustatory receptor 28b [Asbolus verrucosus]|uniref:Gustatory receptor n=1 Tax=Asbolus verrucosus TaxID=1661398 RepID=A0A482VCA8_ASBVE|nr:gustatory receptor 28b [Asbolus verrucosus]